MSVSTLIYNERAKLLAGALNTAAISSFTIGVLAPLAASFYSLPGSTHVETITVLTGIALWFSVAAVLHLCAWTVLGRLRHD